MWANHFAFLKSFPWAIWGMAALLMLAGGLGLYACASSRTLPREVAATPRDPASGVVRGAEAVDLDPPAGQPRPTRAVLLLHGFVGSRKDFADLGQRLAAQGLHVRLARLPGHGTTPDDFARQTPETMLAGAQQEYRALRAQYKEVDVIGFSMGGALATLLASREDVHRLVLVAPYYGVTYRWFYLLPPETWNAMLGWSIPYVVKSELFVQVNRRESVPYIYSYHCVPTRGVTTLVQLGREARRPETLARVRCPVLLVHAEGDMASSPRAARRAYRLIASPDKAAHWFSKRDNHQLLWDYDAEEAKEAVSEFLNK